MGLDLNEILQYTLPSLIVLLGVYFLVNRFLEEESNRLNIMLRQSILKENQKISLPIRLQAYERLVLLLERMHPEQLIARNATHHLTATQYRDLLIADLQTEFQYNLTQQIYVSADIWQLIMQVRSQMKVLLKEIAENLPIGSTADDYVVALLKYTQEASADMIPANIGLKYIKNEVAQMY